MSKEEDIEQLESIHNSPKVNYDEEHSQYIQSLPDDYGLERDDSLLSSQEDIAAVSNKMAELRRIAEQNMGGSSGRYLTDDEIADSALSAQISVNRSSSKNDSSPTMASIIDDPIPAQTIRPISASSDPGDRKILRRIGITLSIVFSILTAAVVTDIMTRDTSEKEETARGQSIIAGEEVNNKTIQGGGKENDSESQEEEEKVAVPRGGSKITYEITAEGSITGVSLSYVDGNGVPASEVNSALPFKKTVGAKASVSPVVKANSTGYGTVSCSIKKNGKVVSEETVSGEAPTISCNA